MLQRKQKNPTAWYLSSAFYVLIGLVVAIISVLLFYVVSGIVHFERIGYGFAFGIGFALSIPTFMIPLVMIFGTDKTEPLMFVSVIAGLLLFFGGRDLARGSTQQCRFCTIRIAPISKYAEFCPKPCLTVWGKILHMVLFLPLLHPFKSRLNSPMIQASKRTEILRNVFVAALIS